jgi:hypothetical protein
LIGFHDGKVTFRWKDYARGLSDHPKPAIRDHLKTGQR